MEQKGEAQTEAFLAAAYRVSDLKKRLALAKSRVLSQNFSRHVGLSTPAQKSALVTLLDWYAKSARPLPWRVAVPDPYAVWISEVMSQQSTMESVLGFFDRWMRRFPTLETLARASEEEVLAQWAGLGYYSRARNVHRAALALLIRRQKTGELWPQTVAGWLELPGVGPYTASAVTAICFDQPVLPLDGNVLRVSSRLRGIPDPLNTPADRLLVDGFARATALTVPKGQRGAAAQALMELGALICKPGDDRPH